MSSLQVPPRAPNTPSVVSLIMSTWWFKERRHSLLAASYRSPAHFEPDWRDIVPQNLQALGKAWDDPAAWEGIGGVPGSELSNTTWGKITLTELVVHGWDIATAIGQTFDLPENTLQACFDHVAVFVPNAPLPDLWGPPIEVSPDAPLLDRIVAITGRAP
jgi:uncharacterized protein (TIGR03086 family)